MVKRLLLHYGDIGSSGNLTDLIYNLQPDEIYHLAAQSHVRVSFDMPEYTGDVTGSEHIARAGSAAKKRLQGAFLPGFFQRDVWQRQAAPE